MGLIIDPNTVEGQQLLSRLGISVSKSRSKTKDPKKPAKPSKYRSNKIIKEGIIWDSIWEWQCWVVLKSLEKRKLIFDLDRQVVHRLEVEGELIGKLIADFTFRFDSKTGPIVTADAKSKFTAKATTWRRAIKLFRAIYKRDILVFYKNETDIEKEVLLWKSNMLN